MSHIGDAPVLPDLLAQIPVDQEIGSVTADGAYDTRKCHDAIAEHSAHAVVGEMVPLDHFLFRLTPAAEEREALQDDHRRSRVEI